MLKQTFLASCFILGMGGNLLAQATTYTLAPQTVQADLAFALTLKNPKFTCATTFSNQSLQVNGDSLYAGFKAVNNTGVTCAKTDTLYGPSFQVPALRAGSYAVFALQEPACSPLCAIPIQLEFAGTLTVKAIKDSSWFIQPRQTQANKPFTLQLLSYAYGNCQTSFTHTSLDTGRHSLYLSFVIENHPERVCVADIRPYGPSYDIQGLKVGKYPVYAVQHVACEYSTPPCPTVYPLPKFVDTLFATSPTSVFLKPDQARGIKTFNPLGTVEGYWLNGRKAIPGRSSR